MNLPLLLQAPVQANALGGEWTGIGFMVLIFVVFYFFLFIPQSKRQKAIKKFQNSLN